MIRILFCALFAGTLLILVARQPLRDLKTRVEIYEQGLKKVEEAEKLEERVEDNPESLTRQNELFISALRLFRTAESQTDTNDSLDVHCYIQSGLILHLLDSITAARLQYNRAIKIAESIVSLEDSFLFKPYLYTGSILHAENKLDSALHFYKKAETIQQKYHASLEDAGRLYNRLGVIHYETGNYTQARNYFEEAIAVLAIIDPDNEALLVNYRMNIGSMHVKLEEYAQARIIFESLLPYGIYKNEILHNIGIINQQEGKYQEALASFRQVNYGKNKRNVDLYYNLAKVFHHLAQTDSCERYLTLATSEHDKWNANRKAPELGLINILRADRLMDQSKFKEAINAYQLAIIQFDPPFNVSDPGSNPTLFTGVFSYLNLFRALVAKAEAYVKLARNEKGTINLANALNAYQSAFNLATYIERTYDSDESRLFLNRIKYSVHGRPIDVAIDIFERTGEKKFLETAYFFDQLNKASVLSLNVRENELSEVTNRFEEKFSEQRNLKRMITSLSIRTGRLTDSAELQKNFTSMRDLEIRLAKIHQQLLEDPQYREHHFSFNIPAIADLQKTLDKSSAILSYHLAPNNLLAFFISSSSFTYKRVSIDSVFFKHIHHLKNELASFGDLKGGKTSSDFLFSKMISPLIKNFDGIDRIILIPDDELNNLPVEALRDENDRFLLEKFSFQYQFTTSLLQKKLHYHKNRNVLSVAPFVRGENTFADPARLLPYSGDEISELKGTRLLGPEGTKTNFISAASNFRYIHLATHAQVNNDTPSRSFISFYASRGAESRLFADEISSMNLDSTELIILSACETGAGKLIKGEGLISLSRAFAYAGCHDIITSLWKADDKSTAFIMKRTHVYLSEGLTKDKALQKAKLDLLKSPDIEPNFKTTSHWSHLTFIGQYEKAQNSNSILVVLLLLLIGVNSAVLWKNR